MNIVISPKFKGKRPAKDIDFLPARLRAARRKRRKALLSGILAVLLAAALFSLYAYPQKLIREYERELAAENAMIQDLEKGKEVYERLQAKQARYDTVMAALNDIEKQRFEALDLMEKIGGALPPGVMVSKLSLTPDKVSFTVVSASPVDTARVIVALRRLDLFKEVELPGAPMSQEPKEVSFDLALKDRPSEAKSTVADFKDRLLEFARKYIFKEGEYPGWLTGDFTPGQARKPAP